MVKVIVVESRGNKAILSERAWDFKDLTRFLKSCSKTSGPLGLLALEKVLYFTKLEAFFISIFCDSTLLVLSLNMDAHQQLF
jgi:hypothetical protein